MGGSGNALMFNALQKAVFYTLKDGLLRCNSRQIGTRFAANGKAGENIVRADMPVSDEKMYICSVTTVFEIGTRCNSGQR